MEGTDLSILKALSGGSDFALVAPQRPLGRRTPSDMGHVMSFPLSAVMPATVANVERTLRLPWWHWRHDQGMEGSCVGHAVAMERAISNSAQNRLAHIVTPSRWYDPLHVWNEAKKIDEWPDTMPGDTHGTSVRAAYDVARDQGVCRVKSMKIGPNGVPVANGAKPVDPAEGVAANRWALTVDEMRTAISLGNPVVIGVAWYTGFDAPEKVGRDWYFGRSAFGGIRGGHSICVYGASDRRDAFKVKNSWGTDFPLAYLPYTAMERLLLEDGEAALHTDR